MFKKVLIITLCFSFLLCGCDITAASIQSGDSGARVKEIQLRLKNYGYYNGIIDGKYGEGTKQAVTVFQRKHGLNDDGVVDDVTAAKLGVDLRDNAKKPLPDREDSPDIILLAKLIHAQTQGEPYKAKVAVGGVVLNRVVNSKFPNTIYECIYQKGAFDIVREGKLSDEPDESSLRAARDAMNGHDPSCGALFFTATPNTFLDSMGFVTAIGNHRFYK